MMIISLSRSAAMTLLMLAMPLSVFASAGITASFSGAGSYVIDGVGFDKVAAIELTITYDVGVLSNPRLTQGPLLHGALVAVNPNSPGVIRLAAVTTSPLAGSGRLASLVFDANRPAGGILSISARLSALNGNAIPVSASVLNPGIPSTASQERNQASSSLPSRSVTAVSGGSAVVHGEAPPAADSPGTEDNPDTAVNPEEQNLPDRTVIASREPLAEKRQSPVEAARTRKVYTQQSVLDRFREYKGERTPKALIALFEQDMLIGYRQEPPIALSDGKKSVKAIFIAPSGLKGAPDIAVAGASLLSLGRHPEFTNTWIAEVAPYKNISEAVITVPLKDITMILPLTISPPSAADLDKSGRVTEEDFKFFLKGPGVGKTPIFDLNGDGRQDYLDNFIFTVNYILTAENEKPEGFR